MSISTVLLIVALICFILASIGVPFPRISLGWAGLAFVTIAWLIAGGGLSLK